MTDWVRAVVVSATSASVRNELELTHEVKFLCDDALKRRLDGLERRRFDTLSTYGVDWFVLDRLQ